MNASTSTNAADHTARFTRFACPGGWPQVDNAAMPSASQVFVPPSFIALFVPAGRIKPGASRAHIEARYELCEDLAQMLVETADARRWQLGITRADALERIARGLPETGLALDEAETGWVMTRLAELLGPDPD